jgi:hypothetical protein
MAPRQPVGGRGRCLGSRPRGAGDFATYCAENGGALAEEYGFNQMDSYDSESPTPEGSTLLRELEAYKQAKDAGSAVIAVFVCDVSGSMDGAPIQTLQSSLVNSMRYIGTTTTWASCLSAAT